MEIEIVRGKFKLEFSIKVEEKLRVECGGKMALNPKLTMIQNLFEKINNFPNFPRNHLPHEISLLPQIKLNSIEPFFSTYQPNLSLQIKAFGT